MVSKSVFSLACAVQESLQLNIMLRPFTGFVDVQSQLSVVPHSDIMTAAAFPMLLLISNSKDRLVVTLHPK